MVNLDLISALVGAVTLGGIPFVYGIIRLRVDLLSVRCDELRSAVAALSDSSLEYWLTPFSAEENLTNPDKDTLELVRKGQLLEARMLGFQRQMDLAFSEVRASIPSVSATAMSGEISSLVDAATGGDFLSRDGKTHQDRANRVAICAAELNARIAQSRRDSYRFKHLLWRAWNEMHLFRSQRN